MASLSEIEEYCNRFLGAGDFSDYCPNGLQVDGGGSEVRRILTGVTASQALIDVAVEREVDLLLVHHGYFWKGEAAPLVGIKGRRVRSLMTNGISMMAYHLPLDAHPELGNNRLLGEALGFSDPAPVGEGLLWQGGLDRETPEELAGRIADALERAPLHIPGGVGVISRVGWCTGAAQGAIEQAAACGLDAFITGEVSESTVHLAREYGIHFFAAGHHATERFGVRALGDHLAEVFGLHHEFADVPNPV